MLKGHRYLFLFDQALVEDIKHLEKGHVFVGLNSMRFERTGVIGIALAPDMES